MTMAQKMYIAKITLASGGTGVEVTVPANDSFQAKKMIESQYGPVKTWWKSPTLMK
jgi:LEA14-like dessication related protein